MPSELISRRRPVDPEALPQARAERDELSVDVRSGTADRLDVHLPELPVAARLRRLVAEHRTDAPQLVARATQHAVGNQRARDAGGGLRAQRQAVPAAVGEGVHLLADHVGVLADRALEELGVLQDRYADLLVAIGGQQLARQVLKVLPGADLRGQHIVHSADRLDLPATSLSPRGAHAVGRERAARFHHEVRITAPAHECIQ